MQLAKSHQRNDPEATGDGQRSRWSWMWPGRSLLLFPLVLALLSAIVISIFASIGRLWGPEDEQGTWVEVIEAASGNFAFVFVAAFLVSAIMRIVRNRSS